MTEDQERMIDRVMKLLAKAESTTPEEAESLMAKAQEIMTRHAIDEAMLAHARGELVPDEIIEHRIRFTGIYSKAHRELSFAVAHGAQFRVLQSTADGTHCSSVWVGYKRDIQTQELLLTSLLIQAEKFQRDFMRDWNADHPYVRSFEKFVARRAFLEGFADGISSRLVQARLDATKQAQSDYDSEAATSTGDDTRPSTSVELVLLTKQQRVDDWYDEKYSKLKAGRASRTRGNYSASDAGRSAAAHANLGSPGVGGPRGALGR